MLRTSIVTLSAGVEPEFPNECVGCGAEDARHQIRASDRAFHWGALWSALFWFAGRKQRSDAPACATCRRGDVLQKWGRVLITIGLITIVMSWIYPWVKSTEMSRGLRRLTILGLCVTALVPFYLWTMWFPRAFTMDVSKKSTDFEFARDDYAKRFAEQNGGSVEE